nr:alpha/beta hydrolase-fold protein [Chitinophaga nivalis]
MFLQREVVLELYCTAGDPEVLLLMNDGQDLPLLLSAIPDSVWVLGIHAGLQRRQEYGTAGILDYQGQGRLAGQYTRFVIGELLPFLTAQYPDAVFKRRAFAGCSLGGLSALDIVWRHPEIFQLAAVFSGALWWRSRALDAGYRNDRDRIMHRLIREGSYQPGLQFFFECGTADETADRNHNGIIDSIDDTRDLLAELERKGYEATALHYLEIPGGRHDIPTWKTAMEVLLQLPFFSGKTAADIKASS